MFCTKCGAQLPENAQFCSTCGTSASGGESAGQPDSDPQKENRARSLLIWAIIGLACALNFPLLGIIFSKIAKNKAADYTALYGQPEGMANVGSILANVGFVVALVEFILVAAILTLIFCIYGTVFAVIFS